MRALASISLAIVVAAALAGSAAAAPSTLPGWPRAAPAGTLLQGPGGGVVVVNHDDDGYWTTAAYRRDGRRLWAHRRSQGCGICLDGPQFPSLQADGTYGPVGPAAGYPWAVEAPGHEVAGCTGVVLADSTCIRGTGSDHVEVSHPAIRATGPSGEWTVADLRYLWVAENGVPPMTVRDSAGRIYSAFGSSWEAASGVGVPGPLMVVDPTSRTLLWTRVGPREVLAALPSGVLVTEEGRTVALGADGSERWSRPFFTEPDQVVVDAARDRVYVGSAFGQMPVVRALALSNGATVWRTRTADRARLMSVGRGGRVYLAIDAPRHLVARAVRFSTGGTVWEHRTSQPVQGTRELVNGTVAIAAGLPGGAPTWSGRMAIVDPR